jgi:hypothetical protein
MPRRSRRTSPTHPAPRRRLLSRCELHASGHHRGMDPLQRRVHLPRQCEVGLGKNPAPGCDIGIDHQFRSPALSVPHRGARLINDLDTLDFDSHTGCSPARDGLPDNRSASGIRHPFESIGRNRVGPCQLSGRRLAPGDQPWASRGRWAVFFSRSATPTLGRPRDLFAYPSEFQT